MRIAVVGGGMAGLGAARVLEDARAADPSVDWHLYEDEPRFGGKVQTVRRDGFVVEGGPDSAIIEKPWPIRLARELGIGDRFQDSNEDIRKQLRLRARAAARAARGHHPDGADAHGAVRAQRAHQLARQGAHGSRPACCRAAAPP